MVGKAPSEGTKVTLGDKAPVTQEGAGNVSGSLAAESAQSGGEFSNNRNVNESGGTDTGAKPPGTSSASTSTSGGAAAPGTAPTYVNNQYARDSGGPHGKNITEDQELTGRPAKFDVEPGSKEDPARLAEQHLRLKQTRGAPGTGERQDGAGDQQPYGVLDNETSA
ncbi:hypothetical protein J7T55_009334 [Diaporthe amygdali]|uniref:uncharacterized protein n=1 Tax=Phomopsis amygdali TaxID=1214568 RepID=UPI0022FE4FF4|nr:uncharacterized protein J7T55_009334 [Diaporthe amygdali]KAJ0107370.1 hypothetical protein J7T55_009334 [Diaporthe amygdali]